MGDAADDAFESAFNRDMEFTMLVKGIKETCTEGGECRIVSKDFDDYQDGDDWLPYKCTSCGKEFDY